MGEIAYWVGARLGVRHCSLCDITHSLFRVKPSWLEVANKLKTQSGILFMAYHRNDQPADVRAVIAGRYPAIVARKTNNELHLFMSDVEITSCGKSPEDFLVAITKKLSE